MLFLLTTVVGALDAYEQCLKIEPSNAQAKQGLASVNDAISKEAAEDGQTPDMGLGSIFQDPNWLGRLAQNPKTAGLLGDQAFMEKLVQCAKNPSKLNEELRDPRMMQVIAVLLGLNLEMPGAGGPGGPAGPASSEDTPVCLSNTSNYFCPILIEIDVRCSSSTKEA